MKRSLLSLFALASISLQADESPSHSIDMLQPPNVKSLCITTGHQIFPRFFIRSHREGGYAYDMYGFGVGYKYAQSEGLNFKAILSTNLNSNRPFIESDMHLGYAISSFQNVTLIPYIAIKNATHQINKIDETKYVVTKGSFYSGIGIKPQMPDKFEGEFRVGLSRDLYNVLLHSSEDKFTGRKFSNPFGYALELIFGFNIYENIVLMADCSFAQGFDNEFRNYGGGLTAYWNF